MAEAEEVEAQCRLELKDLPTLRRLGRGLSGYLYETTWGGNKCARKDFPLGSAERNSVFEREVRKVCKLDDHPNVVKCFGYTVGTNSCSLVQEYVADNLQNSVQRRRDEEVIRRRGTSTPESSRVLNLDEIRRFLSSRGKGKENGDRKVAFEAVPEAADIISQIATGMRHLHEKGVVHGDLKPRNVLVLNSDQSGGWKVKLADYGLTETKKRIRMVSERTRRAEILSWKAPECLGKMNLNRVSLDYESDTDSDEETDSDECIKSKLAMADVYSFGLTCSYILGGKPMSSDMSLTQLRQRRMQGFKPKLPESASLEYLKFVIGACLEPEPLKRPAFFLICMMEVAPSHLRLQMLKDVMEGRWRESVPQIPSEVGLPGSLQDRSVDSPEQINTMSTFSGAPREMFPGSPEIKSSESPKIFQLEDVPTTMLPERGNQGQNSTKHNSSLFDVVGATSMQITQKPFKPWQEHVQISAPLLRRNDRINQQLLRRCIDMVKQIPNSQKMQNPVLSSSANSGVTHSTPVDVKPRSRRPQAGERIANKMGMDPVGKGEGIDDAAESHHSATERQRRAEPNSNFRVLAGLVPKDGEDTTKPVTGRGGATKRSRAAEVYNQSERRRRVRINERMRALKELIPNSNKTDKASTLDEAIEYLKMLQLQLQMMSIRTGMTLPPMVVPPGLQQQMQMPQMAAMPSMGMGMGMVDLGVSAPGRAVMPMSFPAGPSLNLTMASPSTVVDMHDVRYQASGGVPMVSINAYMAREIPSEITLPRTVTDRSVDDIWKEVNTMSTFSEAPREISHSSITSYLTRETSSCKSLLEDVPTTMLPDRGNQGQNSSQHNSSLFDAVGATSMQMTQKPFKPWQEHVQISAPLLRKNDRINQQLLRRCIDMVKQIPNSQKMQNPVLSSSANSGVTHSTPVDVKPRSRRPQADEWIANTMGIVEGPLDNAKKKRSQYQGPQYG